MAFAPDDPNAPQNQNPVNNPMAQPPQTASGIGAGAGGVSSPQGVTATLSATKAPPVTNLGDYLKANAPQVNDTANRIAEGLNTQAGQIQTDLNSGQAAFDTAIGGGSVAPNPDLVGRAAADPTAFVKNPDDVAAFAKQRDATYTGPTDFTTSDIFSQLSGEVAKAAGQAPNASNPNDLWGVASSQETNPTYGMTALDTLLLQQNPDAVSTLNTARAPFGTFSKSLDDLVAKENAGAKSAQTATAAAASGAVAPFTAPGGVVPTFSQRVADRLAQAQQGTNAYNQEIEAYIQSLNDLQSHLAPFENATGAPLSWTPKDINPITSSPTMEAVATPEDFAVQSALEMLLGSGYATPPLNPALASRAGTFSVPSTAIPTMSDMAKDLSVPLAQEITAGGSKPGTAGQAEDTASQALARYLSQFDPEDYYVNTLPDGGLQWKV